MNEHFSGVNAGTMFGDGLYFAEDMGKSDQYCAPVSMDQAQAMTDVLGGSFSPSDAQFNQTRFVFLTRVVLGCIAQVGEKRNYRLGTRESIFSAGTRELAFIPGCSTPTHFHSELAEISNGYSAGRDTHTEPGGNRLRFREFIIFHPTLIYPEYLISYRRQ
eukprot:gnl/MRDRNA2_/MRDRNA2_354669_c0_seq1.p1 gnl/MRDRNA2_/MRDRNA2_354669_c0~~gnl/MRDRNA2_/MRDRNA2_354669_c0_seq1.p1  ORF type:complete len:183 (-),score=22.30 gnl/MRDRNA2_/MRDRNA2_354669_c0_seq1:140-622(-)